MSTSNDRLEKRRAVNRQSQRRARAQKEDHIKDLERTNSQLEDEVKSLKERLKTFGGSALGFFSASPSSSDGLNRSSHSATAPPSGATSSAPQHSLSTAATSIGPPAASIDLEACRQAFLAVLASVCDPHLNTIHAVATKFASSRNPRITNGNTNLNHPRPVNRPLNQYQPGQFPQMLAYDHFNQSHATPHNSPQHTLYPGQPAPIPDNITAFLNAAFPSLPPASYVPEPHHEGPLYVANFEPIHPLDGFELDADGVWSHVLMTVDMTKVDAEDLAGKLAEKIRCYGFGPVLLRRDVTDICQSEWSRCWA